MAAAAAASRQGETAGTSRVRGRRSRRFALQAGGKGVVEQGDGKVGLVAQAGLRFGQTAEEGRELIEEDLAHGRELERAAAKPRDAEVFLEANVKGI